MAKTAESQRSIPFPECRCGALDHLGVYECENICPYKFDKDGKPRKTWDKELENRIWRITNANVSTIS